MRAVSLGVADCLSLAAAPVFALMTLSTALFGGGAMDMICSAAHGQPLLGGMVPMYALMCAFHLGPWLKLASRARSRAIGAQ